MGLLGGIFGTLILTEVGQDLSQELSMERAAQTERDMAIYRAHVDGARYDALAEQYGITVGAISQAVKRVQDALPAPEKAQEVRRAVDLCDDLIGVYVPAARRGNTAASREARGWLQLKAKWMGIDRKEVQVHGQVDHLHHWEPGPTVEQVLNDWRDQGILQGEIRRLDP
jgi:hypothetical protein